VAVFLVYVSESCFLPIGGFCVGDVVIAVVLIEVFRRILWAVFFNRDERVADAEEG